MKHSIFAKNLTAAALAVMMFAGAVPALAAESETPLPEDSAAQQEETVEQHRKHRRPSGKSDGTNAGKSDSAGKSDGTDTGKNASDTSGSDTSVKRRKPARKPSRKPERKPERKTVQNTDNAAADNAEETV